MSQDLVTMVAYGPESPVFTRMRVIWHFYQGYMKDELIRFTRVNRQVKAGLSKLHQSGDIIIGTNGFVTAGSDYDRTYTWSESERREQAFAIISGLKFCRAHYPKARYYFLSSITSIPHYPRLHRLLSRLPSERLFAGVPIQHPIAGTDKSFNMVSGSGMLLSSDIVDLLLHRYAEYIDAMSLLSDVWISYVLRDIQRIKLYRGDFTSFDQYTNVDIARFDRTLKGFMDLGYYHYRVKSNLRDVGRRDIIDVFYLTDIVKAMILNSADIYPVDQLDLVTFNAN